MTVSSDPKVECYVAYLIASRNINYVSSIVNQWDDLEEALHYYSKNTGHKVPGLHDFIAYFKERYLKK